MKFCILISAFCLLTSVGLGQDLSIDTVLGWEDTMPLHPRAIVTNHSSEPVDGVNIYWRMDDGTPNGYSDSITSLYFDARHSETLDLCPWHPEPRGRDSLGLFICVTWSGGDTLDTWYKKILPRYPDVAVTEIIAPLDTLDSGIVVWPSSRVANPGTIVAHLLLRHEVGGYVCEDSATLLPGESREVVASESLLAVPGVWTIVARAILSDDKDSSNDVMTDTFWVRPLPGVEEAPSAELRATNVGPTVLSGSMVQSLKSKVLFDAMGRRVARPRTGIYFLAEGLGTRGQGLGRMRKVIVGR